MKPQEVSPLETANDRELERFFYAIPLRFLAWLDQGTNPQEATYDGLRLAKSS